MVLPEPASVPGGPGKVEGTAAGRVGGHSVLLLLPTQEQEFGLGLGGSILRPLPPELGGYRYHTGLKDATGSPVSSSPWRRRSHHRCREVSSIPGGQLGS